MVSISELTNAFKKCYHSFEICTVCHLEGFLWRNVFTSFYISREVLEAPKETIVFDGDNIKVLKICMDYSDLHNFLEELKIGLLNIHGFNVQIDPPFDYDTLKIREDPYANFRVTEGARTFVFQRNNNVFNNNALLTEHLNQINTEVIKLGFIHAFDFISYYTGIRSYSTSYNQDFTMIIPVFFSINYNNIENGILNIGLTYDNEYRDLQVNIIGYSENIRRIIFRENNHVREKKNVCFTVQSLVPGTKLEIYVFSQRLPELQLKETIWVPINQPLLPFSKTYNEFHKLQDLEIILLKPETLDNKSRSSSYEKAVCDLFSLCGLSTVHLRDHEILQLENKTVIGSADILAYDGSEHLFVIDCDIMVPDPKKMGNLIHLCRYLRNVTENEVENIIPTIVSPNPSTSKDIDVLVLDGGMIQRMFKGVHYLSKKELISMITEQYFRRQLDIDRVFR